MPAGEAQLNTRTEFLRPAHAFSHPDVEDEILAVEHETGVEFLLMGLVAPLAASAIQGFVRWSFKKWKHRQDLAAGSVTPSSLVLEGFRGTTPDGHVETWVRMVVPPPIQPEQIPQYMETFHAQLTQPQ